MRTNEITTFDNEFDLINRKLDEIELKETYNNDKCVIWDIKKNNVAYSSFKISENSQTKTICELVFYKSSKTGKYLPRPIFKKISHKGDIKNSKSADKIIIKLDKSEDALIFWKLIGFLFSYKELVELEEFEENYRVIAKDKFIIEFKSKSEKEKVEDLKGLFKIADLSTTDIKNLTFESRKQNLRAFYYLLKNIELSNGKTSHQEYADKYNLVNGEEYIWHHFLKKHDWILGLNADIKFIIEFLDEQKIGYSDSKGKQNPQTDLLGISEFTVLIELKHSNTNIFKKNKNKARANTWDFTSDFIEGVSQCLGQKFDLDKSFDQKIFIKADKTRLDKSKTQSIDPKTVLILGNKKREFSIENLDDNNFVKNKTLERFRRNNRNIDIITYDELFERAYHIVYSRKLNENWYQEKENEVFKD